MSFFSSSKRLTLPGQFSYSPTPPAGASIATPLDFARLPYYVYSRFVELLPSDSYRRLYYTSKNMYLSCILIRGVDVIDGSHGHYSWKNHFTEPFVTQSGHLMLDSEAPSEAKNSINRSAKFRPYFNIRTISLRSRYTLLLQSTCRLVYVNDAADLDTIRAADYDGVPSIIFKFSEAAIANPEIITAVKSKLKNVKKFRYIVGGICVDSVQ